MRSALLVAICAGCGDDGNTNADGQAPPGLRENSGWKEHFSYRADPAHGLGIDNLSHVIPRAINAHDGTLTLVYAEERLGQQGPIGTYFTFQLTATGEPTSTPLDAPYPRTDRYNTQEWIWDNGVPVLFVVTEQTINNPSLPEVVQFWKDGVKYLEEEVHPNGLGRAAIGPDGRHYAFGNTLFMRDTTSGWVTRNCYPPPNGSPVINGYDDEIEVVDVSDTTRPLGLLVKRGIRVWRTDPAATPEPVHNQPLCHPIATYSDYADEPVRGFRFVVGGVDKIVVVWESTVRVFTYASFTLTLELEEPIELGGHVTAAGDENAFWIAYTNPEGLVTVLKYDGSSLAPVGIRNFTPGWQNITPPQLTVDSGRVFVTYGQPASVPLGIQFGSMWIVTPE